MQIILIKLNEILPNGKSGKEENKFGGATGAEGAWPGVCKRGVVTFVVPLAALVMPPPTSYKPT